eukprot:gene17828-biopygen2363
MCLGDVARIAWHGMGVCLHPGDEEISPPPAPTPPWALPCGAREQYPAWLLVTNVRLLAGNKLPTGVVPLPWVACVAFGSVWVPKT